MSKPNDPNPNKPTTPPGHEEDPGRGQEGAPGQQKPRADNSLPDEPDEPTAEPK